MFFPPCYSQVIIPTYAPTRSDSSQIINKIGEVENYINNTVSYSDYNPSIFIDVAYLKSLVDLDNNSLYKTDELQNVSIQINEIYLNGSTARVGCQISIYTDTGILKTYTENIFLKKNVRWTISSLGYLENIFKSSYQRLKKMEKVDNPTIESQPILLSSNSFIKKHVIQNPQTYQLDINLTQSQLQKQLFGKSQGIDNTYFSDGLNESAFYLDQSWKRVLFSQSSSTQLKILSYGENSSEHHFKTPRSIDVNEWGELYIADSENKVVNKLYYSWITNTITATSNVNFLQGLLKPVDVDYYQGSTLWNRNDDLIAVADEDDNSILIYNSIGTFQCKLTGY